MGGAPPPLLGPLGPCFGAVQVQVQLPLPSAMFGRCLLKVGCNLLAFSTILFSRRLDRFCIKSSLLLKAGAVDTSARSSMVCGPGEIKFDDGVFGSPSYRLYKDVVEEFNGKKSFCCSIVG